MPLGIEGTPPGGLVSGGVLGCLAGFPEALGDALKKDFENFEICC